MDMNDYWKQHHELTGVYELLLIYGGCPLELQERIKERIAELDALRIAHEEANKQLDTYVNSRHETPTT
jgi:hypothetical protein